MYWDHYMHPALETLAVTCFMSIMRVFLLIAWIHYTALHSLHTTYVHTTCQ